MYDRTRIAAILAMPMPTVESGVRATVCGWIRSRRDSKAGVSFIDCNDGSSITGLQIVVPATMPGYDELLQRAQLGASIRAEGQVVPSQGRGQAVELQAERVEVLGEVDPELYPIQKQKMSLEHLRSIPHLRARTRTMQAVMRVRSYLALAMHRFFADRGFTYLHTPIITSGDCEGAGEQFRVTTHQTGSSATAAEDFFAREAFLTVSGQLEGETYACGMGEVYTFGPTFRAEHSNTSRHLAEFWMIEPEMPFCDLDEDVELACDFVSALIAGTVRDCADELAVLEKQAPGLTGRLQKQLDAGYARVSYTEAIERLAKAGRAVEWGRDPGTENERFLVEKMFRKPLVVTDFPAGIKAFYMRHNDDGRTVAAMDVLVPGMGELIGGSQREERLDVLEEHMRRSGLDPELYRPYLDLRRFGSVPHAGFGLGFERLLCLVTGMQNVRDVMPYPRTHGHCV